MEPEPVSCDRRDCILLPCLREASCRKRPAQRFHVSIAMLSGSHGRGKAPSCWSSTGMSGRTIRCCGCQCSSGPRLGALVYSALRKYRQACCGGVANMRSGSSKSGLWEIWMLCIDGRACLSKNFRRRVLARRRHDRGRRFWTSPACIPAPGLLAAEPAYCANLLHSTCALGPADRIELALMMGEKALRQR